MDTGELAYWTENDKSIFDNLLREFRLGGLDEEFPVGIFDENGVINYWKEDFWRTLCMLYNIRAVQANASPRAPYEMILRGEQLKSEFCLERCGRSISDTLGGIFSPCRVIPETF